MRFQRPEIPSLTQVQAYYERSEAAAWFSNNGPCVQLLERRCSEYVGLPAPGVTVNNATSGLMLALRAALGAPDPRRPYVAVPSFTFVASVAAICWAGWQPLFLDVDREDWQSGVDQLAGLAEYADRLAGVMRCSTFGTPLSASRRKQVDSALGALDVPVVVDSAAGFGAHDDEGNRLGDQGDVEVFSFHATKPFAIGEGGILTSRSEQLLARARSLANFGFDAMRELPAQIGINAKLSEVQAATGLAVLDGYEGVLARRRRAAAWLTEELAPHGAVPQGNNAGAAFQFVPVLMPTEAAHDRVIEAAAAGGVEVKVYFSPPMHEVPAFRAYPRLGELKVTSELSRLMVCLPMSNSMTDGELERVRDVVVSALA